MVLRNNVKMAIWHSNSGTYYELSNAHPVYVAIIKLSAFGRHFYTTIYILTKYQPILMFYTISKMSFLRALKLHLNFLNQWPIQKSNFSQIFQMVIF